MRTDRDLLTSLSALSALSQDSACRLGNHLGVLRSATTAEELAQGAAISPKQAGHALRLRRLAPRVARILRRRAARQGARVICRGEDGYPEPFEDLELPPPAIYLQGELPRGPAVAIVGSRRCDVYGRQAAEHFGRELATAGLTVVSGFAHGVDAQAHRGALRAPGGRTVAVLGCGLGVDYPRGHDRLREAVVASGALLTEFPVGCPPAAWRFPIRNRLIAALAQATLVVQATERSGSLITARLALELGRDVYAVPGRIYERRAAGTNALIRDGAHPALSPEELIELLVPAGPNRGEPGSPALPGGEAGRLLAVLEPASPRTIPALATLTGNPVSRVLALLLELELDGWVERLPGPAFSRLPSPKSRSTA